MYPTVTLVRHFWRCVPILGFSKTSSMIFLVLHLVLLSRIAVAHNTVPVIHTIPLFGNDTSIQEEYINLPIVGKCCSVNEILVKEEEDLEPKCVPSTNSSIKFSPLFSKYNSSGIMIPGDEYESFVAYVGNPCLHKRYVLYPEATSDDEHYLLTNGSIFAPHHIPRMLKPGVDYCMENIPELGLRTLVCFPEDDEILAADSRVIFYACGLLISVPFLILTIVAYSITPKLRDLLGKALCHYCGCLALAFTILAITQLGSGYLTDQTCICIAFVIQFSFVACFFWLNVMCIETWLLVQNHVHHGTYRRKKPNVLFFYYSIWAWGPSAVLILLSMIMNLGPTIPITYVKPNFGSESCWFKSDMDAMPYFYVPVGLLLLVNLIFCILTAVTITRYQQDLALRRLARNQESDRQDQRLFRRLKTTFIVCVILFFLMGLNWIMELFTWWTGGDPLEWSAFDLVNALQGVLVFGLFVLRRPPRDFIWYRIQKLRGIDAAEPETDTAAFSLLTVIDSDSLPRQTMI